jgi:PleD family two-component response regulator
MSEPHGNPLPGAELPIIVLTAEDGDNIERRVLELGANDFMVKPFDQGQRSGTGNRFRLRGDPGDRSLWRRRRSA